MLSDTRRERWVALDSAALASPWCPGSNPSSANSQLLHFLKSPCEVPRAAGATCPTHATIKPPPLRPETAGIYCLSVLGPDVPTQRCGRAALPPEASGRVLPGDPASLGLWPYPRSVCIHCRGLSLCLRTPSSLCVFGTGREAGRRSAVWVFWCFSHDLTEGCALLILSHQEPCCPTAPHS